MNGHCDSGWCQCHRHVKPACTHTNIDATIAAVNPRCWCWHVMAADCHPVSWLSLPIHCCLLLPAYAVCGLPLSLPLLPSAD